MRSEKSLFNALLTHFLMGVALGLSLVLLLSLIDAFHVRDLDRKKRRACSDHGDAGHDLRR